MGGSHAFDATLQAHACAPVAHGITKAWLGMQARPGANQDSPGAPHDHATSPKTQSVNRLPASSSLLESLEQVSLILLVGALPQESWPAWLSG